MKAFACRCGAQVFFGNNGCLSCNSPLGFDTTSLELLPLTQEGYLYHSDDGRTFKSCRNNRDFGVCNWLVLADSSDEYCLSCDLNETIPDVNNPVSKAKWARIENAKRRLVYSMRQLGLDIVSRHKAPGRGLGFNFLENQPSYTHAADYVVMTGHHQGLITVNIDEADSLYLEKTRRELREPYRTLIGHFRHESGHYVFDKVITGDADWAAFRELFGDERADYNQALNQYYASADRHYRQEGYISAYASSHPMEDWAETWAHYLHMRDTMETAHAFGLCDAHPPQELNIDEWNRITMTVNELNRSLGLPDAYPFVITPDVIGKLRFVHQRVAPMSAPTQSEATV